MMSIFRPRQAQQRLQQDLHIGRRKQIIAARYERDARGRIVNDDGQVIGGWGVLAGQDNVAESFWLR